MNHSAGEELCSQGTWVCDSDDDCVNDCNVDSGSCCPSDKPIFYNGECVDHFCGDGVCDSDESFYSCSSDCCLGVGKGCSMDSDCCSGNCDSSYCCSKGDVWNSNTNSCEECEVDGDCADNQYCDSAGRCVVESGGESGSSYLSDCRWAGTDCGAVMGGDTSTVLFAYNETNSHVAHPGSVSDLSSGWRLCCNGSGLTDDETVVNNAGHSVDDFSPLLYTYKEENSHVFPGDSSVFNYSVKLMSTTGVDFETTLVNSSRYDLDNKPSGWVPLASFAGRYHSGESGNDSDNLVFDTHVASPRKVWNSGLEDDYQKTLWVGSGIPMLCGEDVMDDSGNRDGSPVCNDSDPVSAFCDNSSDCVALDGGSPECFSVGESFNVDDEFHNGPEVCKSDNHWCPGDNFRYDSGLKACVYEDPQACYDETNPDYCNEKEKVSVSSNVQRAEWLLDQDDCSFYTSGVFKQACCLDSISGDMVFQSEEVVKVYPGGGQEPTCLDPDGNNVSCS